MKRLIALFFIALLIAGCSDLYLKKTTETRELMGTSVKITVLDRDKDKSIQAVNDAFSEIEVIENILSIYKDNSEVYMLNEKGFLNDADNELIYLLIRSRDYSELSDGAFDITVQPILDLYKKSFETKKRAPTEAEIKETLKLVDYEDIITRDNDIRLRKNMKITLGGIAKGHTIDRVIDILKGYDIEHALVNAGGDIRVLGKKDGTKDWSIALRNPRNKDQYISIIKLNNKSVATSGDYERYFDDDKKFHHIVDPRTGYSATELISVTIIADTALEADALATSVFVLGPEKGLELIESLENVEGLLITSEKEIIKSSGFMY
ncbi:FAD:protein FMN transferase [Candidatus Woesearchaeota archaeon]|nr:FAD:protein FMN transferase [Candidatus Woesearchaeota archaeon]